MNVKTPMTQKSTALIKKTRRDYRGELEIDFAKINFVGVQQAVEILLSLMDTKASSMDYASSFLFIVKSQRVLNRLITSKLKGNEWLRVNCILKFLQKYTDQRTTLIKTTVKLRQHKLFSP